MSIQQAREKLARAEAAFDSIEESIRRADQQQNRLNGSIRNGTSAVLADVNWIAVVSASILAGLLSILTSAAGLPEVEE